ncbi:hypothetical protein F511_33423 [Dorcoceras hygrometricum]|uniref:Uncharacterized protein n=1 Tax=Dorcoceras hygrometricum TaxID=472368 RepID=A0A2Z7BGT0_9LAMI|nr:hypothetical protein F511_33423 [Dorcoceras hygrometricum]
MGSNPSTESNYKTAVNSKNKMQMLCIRPGITAEGYNQEREPKNSMHSSTKAAIDMCGHGANKSQQGYECGITARPRILRTKRKSYGTQAQNSRLGVIHYNQLLLYHSTQQEAHNKALRGLRGPRQQQSTIVKGDSHPCSIPEVLAGGTGVSGDDHVDDGPGGHDRKNYEQVERMDDDDRYEENLEYDTQMDHGGQNEVAFTAAPDEPEMFTDGCPEGETFEITDWVDNIDRIEKEESTFQHEQVSGLNDSAVVVRTNSKQSALQTMKFVGHGIFSPVQIREINWVAYFLPKIDPASKGKETLVVMTKPTLVEEHCQLVLNSAWDNVSAHMNTFDEWVHFRKEVRIKVVSSFEHLAQIEEQLLVWGKTEQVSELSERRSLIMYKLYELEVQKLYTEHLANFKLDVPSVNHDYLCLPIVAPEASFIGSASDQSQFLALEFSSRAEQEQAATQEPTQHVLQQNNVNEAVNSQEHQAHENEPPVPTEETQALDNEHRAHESSHIGSQRMIISSPHESPPAYSKLEEVYKVVSSIDSSMIYMESKLTSLYSRVLSVDSRMMSMDSRLKNMDSKLEELLRTRPFVKNQSGLYHRTLYDKVDTLATNVTSSQTTLETNLVRQLAAQQYQFTTELDMVKLQLSELVNHFKHLGDAKKGKDGQNRPGDGSNRPGGE